MILHVLWLLTKKMSSNNVEYNKLSYYSIFVFEIFGQKHVLTAN